MIENSDSSTGNSKTPIRQYLFNPFKTAAGIEALSIGLIILLIAAFIGSLSNTHFDGVLDMHSGLSVPTWMFLAESAIDWLCLVLFLYFSALIISRSQWRFIDLAGTEALARWPMLITALVMLPDANRRFLEQLMSQLKQNKMELNFGYPDAIIFFIASTISVLMIIWMVALMYRAYSVSCNVKGAKAIVTFIISLILAEIVSKILIILLFSSVVPENAIMSGLMPNSRQNIAVLSEFENDPQLIGTWESVDFVRDVNDFQPGAKRWQGDLFLKELTFKENGRTSIPNVWTNGWIYTADVKIKAQYYIRSENDKMYLFFPWLSGDVTIRKMKPAYYVLQKVSK